MSTVMDYNGFTYQYFTYGIRVILIALLCLLCNQGARAQSSFEKIFEGEPKERIALAFDWVNEHSHMPDSAGELLLLNQLLHETEERNDKYLNLVARYSIAYFHVVSLKRGEDWEEELNKVMEKAEQTDAMLWANMVHRKGLLYYHVKKEYAKGLGLLLQAHELFTELGYENNPRASNYTFELAWVYYYLGNYQECIKILTPAQHYSDTIFPYVHLQVLNTIGLAYRNLNVPDSAFAYFNRTLQVARDHNNLIWIGVASINISKYYIQKGEYDKALLYAEVQYKNSKIKDNKILPQDSCEALIVLAKIDMHNGDIDKALVKLSNAETGLNAVKLVAIWWELLYYDLGYQLYVVQGDAYEQKGNHLNAFSSYLKAYQYRDTLEVVRKKTQSQKVHTEIMAQQYLSKLRQLKNEKKVWAQARNFSVLVLLLGGAWLFLLYSRQRLKSRKDRQLFENRGQILHTEKLHAEEQLHDYIQLLQEKNKKLEEISQELLRLRLLPGNTEGGHAFESMEKLKLAVIITEDDWFRFIDLFENVHPGFFTRLKGLFPDITQSEMRLMALLKLNMSTNSMAGVLGVSPESIRKTAYRFRKKIPAGINKNLTEIVQSV
ncbi:MAG: tetratricopeptide repeat protein [Bacteroidota bacterium]